MFAIHWRPLFLTLATVASSEPSEPVQCRAPPLQSVQDILCLNGLATVVLSVRDRSLDDVLEVDLEYPPHLLVNITVDALDTTAPGQPADCGLRDPLDRVPEHLLVSLGPALAEALAALSTSRHDRWMLGSFLCSRASTGAHDFFFLLRGQTREKTQRTIQWRVRSKAHPNPAGERLPARSWPQRLPAGRHRQQEG